MNIAKIITFFLMASTAALNGQQKAISRATNQQGLGNYITGVALSCGMNAALTKAAPLHCINLANDALAPWPEEPLQDNLSKQEQLKKIEEQLQQFHEKKAACIAALKKCALYLAAYWVLLKVQHKVPAMTLYQSESSLESWAVFAAPYIASWLLSKGVNQLSDPIKKSPLMQWALLFLHCCINYLAVMQVHGFFQPYTMPTTTQHIFNFTGNYLAPSVCCQFIV